MSKNAYNDTVNLPQTDFSMRASSSEAEPKRVNLWLEEDAYARVRAENGDRPNFTVHCGPPYANGRLHGGHLVPNMLKDIVVRSKNMAGFDAPFIPGWDCHGLPIEWRVEKDLQKKGILKQNISPDAFRAMCREYAANWVTVQKTDWQRMGSLADWKEPYLTMDFETEAEIVRVLGDLANTGLLYKDVKPVMWSPVEGTALAEAEIEYQDMKARTVYVAFDMMHDDASLVAWTTTPWTLPINKALAVSTDAQYTAIKATLVAPESLIQNDKVYWIADSLIDSFAKASGIQSFERVKSCLGSELVGVQCRQPIYGFSVPVLAGDHVTTDEGTGIVHIAPAHGLDDFLIGKANKLDVACAVNGDGRYDDTVSILPSTKIELRGKSIWDAEALVLDELKAQRLVLAEKIITHSYPVSWRSKAPLICRTTSQWFVALDKPYTADGKTLRERALEEIGGVQWIPEEGESRIRSMISERPDWCISRQRLWGVPLAIFRNKQTGEYLFDREIFESVAKQVDSHGVDAWSSLPVEELVSQEWLDKHGVKATDLVKETDILDVWFDSGSSFAHVVKKRPGLQFPADIYLEGSDQHRGWFQSSLLLSVALENKAPYKTVITHGFVVDRQGHKISKSLGNGADAIELMDKYSADTLRMWMVSVNYKGDLRFDDQIMKGVTESYRKIRNTFRYLLGNLYDFNETKDAVEFDNLPEMEKWVLAKYHQVSKEIDRGYSSYNFGASLNSALLFCKNELSGFYFDTRKDVLYCDAVDSSARRSSQTVLSHILKGLSTHLTPILPFTCDEVWRNRYGHDNPVYVQKFYAAPDDWNNPDLLTRWDHALALREKINSTYESAVKDNPDIKNRKHTKVIVSAPRDAVAIDVQGDYAAFLGFGAAEFIKSSEPAFLFGKAEGTECPRCWNIFSAASNQLCGRCSEVLQSKPPQGAGAHPPSATHAPML